MCVIASIGRGEENRSLLHSLAMWPHIIYSQCCNSPRAGIRRCKSQESNGNKRCSPHDRRQGYSDSSSYEAQRYSNLLEFLEVVQCFEAWLAMHYMTEIPVGWVSRKHLAKGSLCGIWGCSSRRKPSWSGFKDCRVYSCRCSLVSKVIRHSTTYAVIPFTKLWNPGVWWFQVQVQVLCRLILLHQVCILWRQKPHILLEYCVAGLVKEPARDLLKYIWKFCAAEPYNQHWLALTRWSTKEDSAQVILWAIWFVNYFVISQAAWCFETGRVCELWTADLFPYTCKPSWCPLRNLENLWVPG